MITLWVFFVLPFAHVIHWLLSFWEQQVLLGILKYLTKKGFWFIGKNEVKSVGNTHSYITYCNHFKWSTPYSKDLQLQTNPEKEKPKLSILPFTDNKM